WGAGSNSFGTIINDASGKMLDDPGFSTSNGALIQQYQGNGGTNQQWTLLAPESTTATTPSPGFTGPGPVARHSSNWSGYVAATNLDSPQAGTVTYVTGSWVVPGVGAASTGSFDSAVWVGIDGYNTNTVEQVGTEQKVVNGQLTDYAWWEMYSSGDKQVEQ